MYLFIMNDKANLLLKYFIFSNFIIAHKKNQLHNQPRVITHRKNFLKINIPL